MKLVYKNMGHILTLGDGCVAELIVENKSLFFAMVNNAVNQSDGAAGEFLLSIANKPVEFSRYTEVILQFAPFQMNRKSLLTKLYAKLEQQALAAENYAKTRQLLFELESFVHNLNFDFEFELNCRNLSIGPVIKALAPEFDEGDKSPLEKIFSYMEIVRELDKDRLFIMVNMRNYFSDDCMEKFIESACLHDFRVLLLENVSFSKLKNTKRYTIDEDLCEF